jgi:hypothetical protein
MDTTGQVGLLAASSSAQGLGITGAGTVAAAGVMAGADFTELVALMRGEEPMRGAELTQEQSVAARSAEPVLMAAERVDMLLPGPDLVADV